MFRLLCRRLQFSFQNYVNPNILAPLSLKSFSSETSSYLRNSWGLSPEIALSVSEKVILKNPEKADRVVSLLKDYGFTETHISNLVESRPKVLLANAHKTLLPKFEFLRLVGILGKDLVDTVSRNPSVLFVSLENNMTPFYNVINRELVLDQRVVKIFERWSWRFSNKKMLSNLGPNISVLRELGVRNTCIVSLLMGPRASVLFFESEKFKENVEKVVGMGFDLLMSSFTGSLAVISTMSTSKWAEKVETFIECGWTGVEVLSAFQRSPVIMLLSKENVLSKMDLLVNEMGWKPADIAGVPNVLHYGLQRWIVPRCSVIRVLLSKDLIKEKPSLSSVFVSTTENFLKNFVIPYQEQVPELLRIFHGENESLKWVRIRRKV